jgi:hypothetical protein
VILKKILVIFHLEQIDLILLHERRNEKKKVEQMMIEKQNFLKKIRVQNILKMQFF